MKSQTATVTGCGSETCLCAGAVASQPTATLNGVALHEAGHRPDPVSLIERAYCELLRQQAVKLGWLAPAPGAIAPELRDEERKVIAAMLDQVAAPVPPTAEDCRHYFEANKPLFVQGQALQVRHILFAVTPGVNVHALTVRAEGALLELSRQGVPPGRFAELASALSDCPTGVRGGDLGWIGPDDCAPELANELFDQRNARWGMGVHPRLVHTGLGFHIVEVLGRRKGKPLALEDVQVQIAGELARQARIRARQVYIAWLVGDASIDGLDLERTDSSWVQ